MQKVHIICKGIDESNCYNIYHLTKFLFVFHFLKRIHRNINLNIYSKYSDYYCN